MKNKKILKIIITLLVAFVVGGIFLSGYFIGKLTDNKLRLNINPEYIHQTELPDLFESDLIQQVWTIIQNDYVDSENIDQDDLYYSALRGFVNGVGDPYTVFLDPPTTEEFEIQINGEFEGIGAEIAIRDGFTTIVSPIDSSPAERAGLQAGDKIISVDGVEVIGESIDEVARKIRGPRGTEVTLLVVRAEEDPFDVVIIRDVIELKSVRWDLRDDQILYVELNTFGSDTMTLVKKMINEVKNKQIKGVVLDMRNNPGGLLNVAIDVSSLWLDGSVVVKEKFGDGSEEIHESSNGTVFADIPTMILINQGSASGSEIVAGALQDHEVAKLIGKKTFGKGSVQVLKTLPDGSAVKVTVAKWLTPKDRVIDGEGIEPDYEVEYTKEDVDNEVDPQLQKALDLLK
jgi:carboxyl-terminal processing protease